tara:strand:+ start:26586 stop:27731 length:1146 start_codon:yes stop_codon:yes gene_type:complete
MSLENEEISNWENFDLDTSLLRGIYSYGFENPSPIQQKAIKPILDGKDVIAQSQSGTGKTGCFVVASLQKIDLSLQDTQIVIMAPTRELSLQIKSVITEIGSYMKDLKTYLLIGGQSTDYDINNFKYETPHLIVGCPGRIHEMIRRKHVNTKNIKLIVLDEADEMLSQGFKEQVYNIFQFLPTNIQVSLFSATLPTQLYNLTDKFMRDPIKIIVKTDMLTLEGIKQYYVNVEDDSQKYETLKDLFSVFSVSQSIIYCNSIKRVQDLYNAMTQDGYSVCQIHSGLEKAERVKQYKDFKEGNQRVLLSSNVTARGIDIQQVSTVINFDIPKCTSTYLHRIGRSGRYGRKGTAINFITKRDIRLLKEIEEFYSTQISELPSNFS